MKYKLYPNYKETKIRWIGEIPREWETYRLKVFIPSVQNGQWGEEPEDKSPMNYITLRVADFLEYTFDLHKELTVRKIQNTKIRLNEGDLVIEKSGGGEKQLVGRVVQLRGSFKNKKYTYSNFLGKLEIHDRMDKTYLNYYFKNLYNNRVNYNYIKQTTGIQNLDVDSLIKNEYFSFPNNKKEQVKIANFLDKKIAEIDKLIEKDK
jgi:type I restriction enzyme S subunit